MPTFVLVVPALVSSNKLTCLHDSEKTALVIQMPRNLLCVSRARREHGVTMSNALSKTSRKGNAGAEGSSTCLIELVCELGKD